MGRLLRSKLWYAGVQCIPKCLLKLRHAVSKIKSKKACVGEINRSNRRYMRTHVGVCNVKIGNALLKTGVLQSCGSDVISLCVAVMFVLNRKGQNGKVKDDLGRSFSIYIYIHIHNLI